MKFSFTRLRLTGLALGISLCVSVPVLAQETKAHMVKAAFIYNFVKFVEWPAERAISKQANIDICVVGESTLMDAENVFTAASTPKLKLSLVQEANAKQAAGHCHVVFLAGDVAEGLRQLKGLPVLTVSDSEGFIDKGGMIGFVMSEGKIKLEVNTRAVSTAGMRVDAQLLEIALRVVDK